MSQKVTSLPEHFGRVDDPRVDRTKQYLFIDMLVIAIVRNTLRMPPRGRFRSQLFLGHPRTHLNRSLMLHFRWKSKINICAHSSRDEPMSLAQPQNRKKRA